MDAAIAKGRDLPQWYLDEPPLFPGDDFYLKAFWRLNTERQGGMDLGPIPDRRILQYGLRAGLDDDMMEVFGIVVAILDVAYREWHEEQMDRQRARNRSGKRTKRD